MTMDFTPSARSIELAEKAGELIAGELDALEPALLAGDWARLGSALPAVRERAKTAGLFAPHMPRELGGVGLTLTEQAHLSEALGRNPLAHLACNFAAPDVGNMELLHAHGSEEQRATWLAPLVAGELRSCFLMTEPEHAGSNPTVLSTTARADGDAWVIDGHKWFATGADGAAFAIVMAVTEPDAKRHARASMILVPTDTPGFELVRNVPVMGHAGSGWFSHGEVRLSGVRVPAANAIGERGAGFALAQQRLGAGRVHHATRWIGVCERALELTCRHAARREVAPGRPLAAQQTVQDWIADSRTEIDAARLLVQRAACAIERGDEHRTLISEVKLFGANVLLRVLDRALQAHGAAGMTDATPLAFWYAHERAARIYDGPDEVHRRVIARAELESNR